jgi:hypothetical protein
LSALYLKGIGVLGPGLPGWAAARMVLRGVEPYRYEPPQQPNPAVLPPAERRRGAKTVRWAVAVASEALQNVQCDPSTIATVFSSSSGDGETLHQICESLASPGREVSPTRFHNSVHNAAAGYWSIAAQSRRPSVTLCGYDGSFAAGLLETAAQVHADAGPVLLVAYDLPYPQPLHAARAIEEPFAVALLVDGNCGHDALSSWRIRFESGAAEPMLPAALPERLLTNPAAHALPLLSAVAAGEAGVVRLYCGPRNHLTVESSPCV